MRPGRLLGLLTELDGELLELVQGRIDPDQGELLLHDLQIELPQVVKP